MEGSRLTFMRGPFFTVVPAFRRGFRRGEGVCAFFCGFPHVPINAATYEKVKMAAPGAAPSPHQFA